MEKRTGIIGEEKKKSKEILYQIVCRYMYKIVCIINGTFYAVLKFHASRYWREKQRKREKKIIDSVYSE